MPDLNPTPDLDVSQLSAVDLQSLGITVAQVRAAYAAPIVAIGPDPNARFPDLWQIFGFTTTGRFIFVALAYDELTGKLAALAVRVADDLGEVRDHLCPVGFS